MAVSRSTVIVWSAAVEEVVENKPEIQPSCADLSLEERMIYRTIELSHSPITDYGIVNAWSPSFMMADVKTLLRALKDKGRIVEARSGGYIVVDRAAQRRRTS